MNAETDTGHPQKRERQVPEQQRWPRPREALLRQVEAPRGRRLRRQIRQRLPGRRGQQGRLPQRRLSVLRGRQSRGRDRGSWYVSLPYPFLFLPRLF